MSNRLNPEQLQELLASMNDREKLFCEHYIVDFNGAKAARDVGYSEKGARQEASELLTKANIQLYLSHLKADVSARCGLTAEMIVKEYMKVGFSNIKDYLTSSNTIKDLSSLPVELTAAVQGITISETSSMDNSFSIVKTTFRLHPKLAALDRLAEYMNVTEGEKNTPGNTNVWVIQRPNNG